MPSAPLPLSETPGGTLLIVRVTPRGGRDRIDGIGVDAAGRAQLNLRVSAPPDAGAANEAVLKLLAKQLKIRKSALGIRSGHSARVKQIALDAPIEQIAPLLRALL
ncbi:MAG: DUF167 family protein [Neomegalonema sp.]|nr:DUF167 family protein [Neomegalonema sp.]